MEKDIYELDGKYHVYAVGPDGDAMGDSLAGPFDTEDEARAAMQSKPEAESDKYIEPGNMQQQRAAFARMESEGETETEIKPKRKAKKSFTQENPHMDTANELAAVKNQLTALTAQIAAKGHISGVKDNEAERPYKSIGEQFIAVMNASMGNVDRRLLHINSAYKAALGQNEMVGSEGAFALQPQFVNDLVQRIYNTGEVLSRVKKTTIGPGSNSLVVNRILETSRANGSRYGGAQAYWTGEAATITASQVAIQRDTIPLEKLTALYYMTDEIMQDVTALSGDITDAMTQELKFKADDAIINGSGAGMPDGVLNSNALVTANKESGQTATTYIYANMLAQYKRVFAGVRSNLVWFYNQDVEAQLFQMALPVGTAALEPRFITFGPNGDLRAFGKPMIAIEQAATLGTAGDVIAFCPEQYQWIEKSAGPDVQSSIHVQFLTGQTAIRLQWRVGGKPMWNSALTPFKGSATLSPYVVVQTRS